MPQDSGSESKKDAAISAASAQLLEQVQAEPVPETILQLAQDLNRALAGKRKAAASRN